jgi:GNAT superfamily N-acetyltransferase
MMKRCSVDQILPLRHAVLRAGKPFETAKFSRDEESATLHYGLFEEGRVKVCLTLMRSELSKKEALLGADGGFGGDVDFGADAGFGEMLPAWQLRGMATEAASQGKGLGGALIQFAVEDAQKEGFSRLFWCNAREVAVPFYERNGWKVISGEFNVPGIGPHYKMRFQL